MSWSDLKFLNFFIVENSKQCFNFNTGYVTNVRLFRNMVVIMVSSSKLWKVDLKNFVGFVVQKVLQ